MSFGYPTWILAGLFLVFGVIMLLSGDMEWRRFWAGLSTVALGGFALSMARDALRTGELRLQHSVIRYADRPRLFWAAVLAIAAAGAAVVVLGTWFFLFQG